MLLQTNRMEVVKMCIFSFFNFFGMQAQTHTHTLGYATGTLHYFYKNQ